MPAVHELTAIACLAPTCLANLASKARTFAPVVSHPDRMTSDTAVTSASSVSGSAKGRKLSLMTVSTMAQL